MKLFLALLAIIACVAADDEWQPNTDDEIKAIRDSCLERVSLTEDQISHVKNFDYPNEEAVRKFVTCKSVRMGLFCPRKGYNAGRVAKQFKTVMDEDNVLKLAEDCINNNPKGDKETEVHAYEVHKCFMDSEIGQQIQAHIKKHIGEMS